MDHTVDSSLAVCSSITRSGVSDFQKLGKASYIFANDWRHLHTRRGLMSVHTFKPVRKAVLLTMLLYHTIKHMSASILCQNIQHFLTVLLKVDEWHDSITAFLAAARM